MSLLSNPLLNLFISYKDVSFNFIDFMSYVFVHFRLYSLIFIYFVYLMHSCSLRFEMTFELIDNVSLSPSCQAVDPCRFTRLSFKNMPIRHLLATFKKVHILSTHPPHSPPPLSSSTPPRSWRLCARCRTSTSSCAGFLTAATTPSSTPSVRGGGSFVRRQSLLHTLTTTPPPSVRLRALPARPLPLAPRQLPPAHPPRACVRAVLKELQVC
jgi:hypothetical protein